MKKALKESLTLTWKWFQDSGVMIPEDGKWDVAERVLLTGGNCFEGDLHRLDQCPHRLGLRL